MAHLCRHSGIRCRLYLPTRGRCLSRHWAEYATRENAVTFGGTTSVQRQSNSQVGVRYPEPENGKENLWTESMSAPAPNQALEPTPTAYGFRRGSPRALY